MQAIIRFLAILLLAGQCICWSPAFGGPYFNSYRTEVDSLSREAVRLLGEARKATIDMFHDLDVEDRKAADDHRKAALSALASARQLFEDLAAKVGDRVLVMKPASADEQLVLAQFRAALEKHKIPFPTTERQLANIAIVVVDNYGRTIARANLDGFPRNWKGVREIILSEIVLLDVGNLVSVVWVISKENS
jgi:RecA/RadA recombinase